MNPVPAVSQARGRTPGLTPLGLTLVVLLLPLVASAQDSFRRGDTNSDGVGDVSDVVQMVVLAFLERTLFPEAPPYYDFFPCADAADIDDSGRTYPLGCAKLFHYLFSGGPEPAVPGIFLEGPDTWEDDGISCVNYEVQPAPVLADLTLGFECPEVVGGAPGEVERFVVYATLTTAGNTTGQGPLGWSISLTAEGATIVDVSVEGVVVTTVGGDVDLSNPRLELRSVPQLASHSAEPDRRGAVSATFMPCPIFPFGEPEGANDFFVLPPEGTVRIARLTLEVTIPPADQVVPVTLWYEDGFRGEGQPVVNVVSMDLVPVSNPGPTAHRVTSQRPELTTCEILVEASTPPGGSRLPSDCNQDGALDLSDGICLLGSLFLGEPAHLPCGDGSSEDPGNVSLLDSNGDGDIDLSDAVSVLSFLFLGSAPPVLGTECLPIAGCSASCAP